MKKKFKKLKDLFHYILLTGVIFLAHWTSDITGVEGLVITNPTIGWIVLFIWYLIWLIISDKLIHTILKVD